MTRARDEHDMPQWSGWDMPREPWLLSAEDRPVWQRSLVLEVAARAIFPTVLLLSLYLLFTGHEDPGGGFSGGLVAGLAFVLRYVAGGTTELSAALWLRPLLIVGIGLSIVAATAMVPMVFGASALASAEVILHPPLLGELELASNLVLDIGVYLLVFGAVLDLVRTLGSEVEKENRRRERGAA